MDKAAYFNYLDPTIYDDHQEGLLLRASRERRNAHVRYGRALQTSE